MACEGNRFFLFLFLSSIWHLAQVLLIQNRITLNWTEDNKVAFIDYYKILGVSKDIPQKDVRRAYLKRAKQFHPDLHPDDPKAKA